MKCKVLSEGQCPRLALKMNRGGCPYLTPAQLAAAAPPDAGVVLSMSAFDLIPNLDVVEGSGSKSLAQFWDLEAYDIIVTSRGGGTRAGYPASEQGIYGNTEAGRQLLTPKLWLSMLKIVRPTAATLVEDIIALDETPARSRRTAISRSTTWDEKLQALAKEAENAETLRDVTVLGGTAPYLTSNEKPPAEEVVVGEKRETPTKQSLPLLSAGADAIYFAHGALGESPETYIPALQALTKEQMKEVMCFCDSVPMMVMAISAGASIVETDLPFTLAERGWALNIASLCQVSSSSGDAAYATHEPPVISLWDPVFEKDSKTLAGGIGNTRHHVVKKHSTNGGSTAAQQGNGGSSTSNLCECYACRRHSRCYVHHLLMVQELNAHILLAIHNVHQLNNFMVEVRRLEKEGRSSTAGEELRKAFCHRTLLRFGVADVSKVL